MEIAAVVVIVGLGFAVADFFFSRARRRAEYEEAVMARLARYAGREVR